MARLEKEIFKYCEGQRNPNLGLWNILSWSWKQLFVSNITWLLLDFLYLHFKLKQKLRQSEKNYKKVEYVCIWEFNVSEEFKYYNIEEEWIWFINLCSNEVEIELVWLNSIPNFRIYKIMFTLTPKYGLNSCLICRVVRLSISKNDERLALGSETTVFVYIRVKSKIQESAVI